MKFVRTLLTAMMVGVLLGGPSVTPTVAASKKSSSALSKVTSGTKSFFNSLNIFKKTSTKKKTK